MRDFLQTMQADLPPLYAISALYTARKPGRRHLVKRQDFCPYPLWTTCFEQIKDLFVKGIRQKKYFQFPKLSQYNLALGYMMGMPCCTLQKQE